jgi:hypothetical protein
VPIDFLEQRLAEFVRLQEVPEIENGRLVGQPLRTRESAGPCAA